MNAFVADHGDGGGEQAGEREQQQPPFEREGDVRGIQAADNGEQDDDFRPRFGRGLVQKAFFLQLFPQICHRMCSHLRHQRTRRSGWR